MASRHLRIGGSISGGTLLPGAIREELFIGELHSRLVQRAGGTQQN
jgi:hypothetical protein